MTQCEVFQDMISRMLDDELGQKERAALSEHVRRCPDCAAVYVAFRSLSESIGGELEEPPATLRENVMAEVRRDRVRAANRKPRRQWMSLLAAAACFALIVSAAYLSRDELWRKFGAADEAASSAVVEQALWQDDMTTYQKEPTADVKQESNGALPDENAEEVRREEAAAENNKAETEDPAGADPGSETQTAVSTPVPTPEQTPVPTPEQTPEPCPEAATPPMPTTPPGPKTGGDNYTFDEKQSEAFFNLMSGERAARPENARLLQVSVRFNGETRFVNVYVGENGEAVYQSEEGLMYVLNGGEEAVDQIIWGRGE